MNFKRKYTTLVPEPPDLTVLRISDQLVYVMNRKKLYPKNLQIDKCNPS